MRVKPDMKPWVNRGHKIKSSVGAALQREHLPYVSEVPPLWGSKCIDYYYPGLAPWAMKSVALAGLIYVIPPYQLLVYFDALALYKFEEESGLS